MKAVRCHRYAALDEDGRPKETPDPLRDVLTIDEVADPACGAGEVLVEAHFAGVQYPDALQAQGLYQHKPELPYVPGMDVSGRVAQVGEEVTHLAVGDRVIAQMQIGGLAELTVVPGTHAWKVPGGIELARVANLGRNFFPAFHSLKTLGEVGPGSLVLVDGASGGVGMAAVELTKALGGKVIAAVSTSEKAERAATVGPDRVVCYGRDRDSFKAFKKAARAAAAELGHPEGVDVVVDMVQGPLFEAALTSVIRPLGKICLVGFTAGQKPIRPGVILIKEASVVGSIWARWANDHPEGHQANVAQMLAYMADGVVVPRVDRLFPFDDAVSAFELFEQNEGRGNTVVQIR